MPKLRGYFPCIFSHKEIFGESAICVHSCVIYCISMPQWINSLELAYASRYTLFFGGATGLLHCCRLKYILRAIYFFHLLGL